MLIAYFDDSGSSSDNEIAVVAGYIATADMWGRFNVRWTNLLNKYNLRLLHRTDLEAFQGEFKEWTGKRRTEFLKKAHAIIRRCTYSGFGIALIKSDFADLIDKHELLRELGMFAWCAHGCMAGVSRWADALFTNEPVNYVFEAGSTGSRQFDALMRRMYNDQSNRKQYHVGEWSFGSKDMLPLQAADTVAYEFYKFVLNEKIKRSQRPIRLSARDLFRQHEIPFFRTFDGTLFKSFLKDWDGTI